MKKYYPNVADILSMVKYINLFPAFTNLFGNYSLKKLYSISKELVYFLQICINIHINNLRSLQQTHFTSTYVNF